MACRSLLFLLCVFFTSCAGTGSSYRPIVDSPSKNYERDLAHCQSLSKQRRYLNADSKTSASGGAVSGGIFGALLGGDTKGALVGAAVGGIFSAGNSVFYNKEEKKQIIIYCLRKRGHDIIL